LNASALVLATSISCETAAHLLASNLLFAAATVACAEPNSPTNTLPSSS